MKKLKLLILTAGFLTSFLSVPVEAQGIWGGCSGSASAVCADKSEATDIVGTLINTFLFVIGALSVIMIVHSGFKYVSSRGEAEQVKSAKNTLLYAVTGLIVAILAFTIVNFVVGIFD